jgi:hypothetical protein
LAVPLGALNDAGDQQQQPEGRGGVGRAAHQQLQPTDPVKALAAKQPQMLEIALAPAPVAHRVVDRGRRIFLIAAVGQVDHVAGPPLPPQQRSFDQIMTHDRAAERLAARQIGKAAAACERPHPEDRVMTPEARLRTGPPEQAR